MINVVQRVAFWGYFSFPSAGCSWTWPWSYLQSPSSQGCSAVRIQKKLNRTWPCMNCRSDCGFLSCWRLLTLRAHKSSWGIWCWCWNWIFILWIFRLRKMRNRLDFKYRSRLLSCVVISFFQGRICCGPLIRWCWCWARFWIFGSFLPWNCSWKWHSKGRVFW